VHALNFGAAKSIFAFEKYKFSRVIQIHADDHCTSSTIFVEIHRNTNFYQKRTTTKVVTRVSHAKTNHFY
jgi:hypothetical protein